LYATLGAPELKKTYFIGGDRSEEAFLPVQFTQNEFIINEKIFDDSHIRFELTICKETVRLL